MSRNGADMGSRQERGDQTSNGPEPTQKELPQAADGGRKQQPFILALDIGTTVMRSHVYDASGHIKGTSSKKLEIEQPKPGWQEIDPHKLFEDACSVMKDSIAVAKITANQVSCIGIATQRNTFVTWDRETGETYHKMITWQDLRAATDVLTWNSSYSLKALNSGAKFLHFFSRLGRYKAASILKFMSSQVTMRLNWVLNNIPNLRHRALQDLVMFGCIETWLLWKLTGETVHATDYSCASSTGMFDPFLVEWSPIVCGLVNIPMTILPEVKDTSGHFGVVDSSILGVPIPIKSVVADQQGAMFGQCCFEVGDVKCTMGTGTFIDLNTGSVPHASIAGLYPLVAWKIGSELVFMAEGHSSDTGNVLEWAHRMGFFEDVADTSGMAYTVKNSGGVCFVPAFSGLQAPVNDDTAVTSIIGMTPNTTKAHIVRAILEGLAFRIKLLYETIITETKIPLSHIRVDGGVSNNNFLMQMLADVINQTMDRSAHSDMTSLGSAFLAGLASGVWKSKEELRAMRRSDFVFQPQPTWPAIRDTFHLWERAVSRSLNWYR